MLIISVVICIRLLKNITPAGKFIFMGMKIDFHACVFRFRLTGIFQKSTIREEETISLSLVFRFLFSTFAHIY